MNPTAKAIAIFCLTALPAAAQDTADTCRFDPGSDQSCVRFVGCIGTDGTYFYGISSGAHTGTVHGRTSTGETCQGPWAHGDNGQHGEGYLNCGPTETAKFRYFKRGKDFSVLSGVSISSQGRRMVTWAGDKLEEYLKERFPDGPHPAFRCGETWVTMPKDFPTPPPQTKANE